MTDDIKSILEECSRVKTTPDGVVTIREIIKATGWSSHKVKQLVHKMIEDGLANPTRTKRAGLLDGVVRWVPGVVFVRGKQKRGSK